MLLGPGVKVLPSSLCSCPRSATCARSNLGNCNNAPGRCSSGFWIFVFDAVGRVESLERIRKVHVFPWRISANCNVVAVSKETSENSESPQTAYYELVAVNLPHVALLLLRGARMVVSQQATCMIALR